LKNFNEKFKIPKKNKKKKQILPLCFSEICGAVFFSFSLENPISRAFSGEIFQNSRGRTEFSAEFAEISPKIGEISSAFGEISPKIGEISPKIGEKSSKIGEISSKIGKISPQNAEKRAENADFVHFQLVFPHFSPENAPFSALFAHFLSEIAFSAAISAAIHLFPAVLKGGFGGFGALAGAGVWVRGARGVARGVGLRA
jgi:hypothetical protein